LKAGADSITKLPAIKYFGKKPAFEIEEGAKKAGREFIGTLTTYPKVDIDNELKGFDSLMKEKIKSSYLKYYRRLGKFE
jgi:hypothetical protein